MRARTARWVGVATTITAVEVGFGCASAVADASHDSERPAVICASDAGGPFVLRAQGTLTRTTMDNEVVYRLKVEQQSYQWRFRTNPDKTTSIAGPGPLIGRLIEAPPREKPWMSPPFAQSITINGELKEDIGRTRLWVLPGTQCPP